MTFLVLLYAFAWISAISGAGGGAWAIVIIGTIALVYVLCVNSAANNYDRTKTDASKMAEDKYSNNLSNFQVKQNMVRGKYDKK